MSDEGRAVGYLISGAVLGGWLFYDGFKKLKLDRKIKGLATSKVQGAAMGTVELFGQAVIDKPLHDPVFDRPCVYYRVKLSVPTRNGWRICHLAESKDTKFYIEDETGRAVIEPDGAEIHLSTHLMEQTKFLSAFRKNDSPPAEYMKKVGGKWASLKLDADIIREGFPLYVLGYARPGSENGATSTRPISFRDIVRKLKADVKRMAKLDINKDGIVDEKEWDQGLNEYQQEIKQKGGMETIPVSNITVSKGPDKVFVFADSERAFLRDLEKSVPLQIIGGPILTVVCLLILFAYWGWF